MATVQVAFGRAMNGAPVMGKAPRIAEVVTSSGTSASTTAVAQDGEFAQITSFNGNCYIKGGATPTATAASCYGIASGQSLWIGPLAAGDKIAVMDAV